MKTAVLVMLATLLAGCMPRVDDADAQLEAVSPTLYTDRVTGCDYLSTGDAKALTPRVAADGKTHMGCGRVIK